MNGNIKASNIGVSETVEHLSELLDSTKGGTFAVIHQYDNAGSSKLIPEGNSEIATYGIQFGIGYDRIKERSLGIIRSVLEYAKGLGDFPSGVTENDVPRLEIPYFTYVDENGVEGRKAKSRTRTRIALVITNEPDAESISDLEDKFSWKKKDPTNADETITVKATVTILPWSDHRVIEALEKASVIQDRPADYLEKEGKSFYGHVDSGVLYLRDCLVMNKHQHQSGDWKESNTSQGPAIKKALQNLTPLGHYRMFKLNTGSFVSLSVGGLNFVSNAGGEVFQTLPEYAKAFIEQEGQALQAVPEQNCVPR